MADEWFYRPGRPVEPPPPPEPAPAPTFKQYEMERLFSLALAALDADGVLDVAYDARLAVIRGYFQSYGRGQIDERALYRTVKAELATMRSDLLGITLGFELASAGMLAIDRPRLAAQFARQAAKGRQALRNGVHRPPLLTEETVDDDE